MLNTLLIFVLLFASSFSIAYATGSQWYWVSNPSNPEEGYFIEGPNVIGKSTSPDGVITTFGNTPIGYLYVKNVQTPLPSNFMDVMTEAKNFRKCSDALDNALTELRVFDSSNQIISSIKHNEEWANEETITKREYLIKKILKKTEDCIEEGELEEKKAEEKANEERERLILERKHLQAIALAVENCDFDFFTNEMTSRERMQTHEERMACQDNATQKLEEIERQPDPAPVYVPPAVISVTTSEPLTYNSFPVPTQTSPVNTKPEQETSVDDSTDNEVEESTADTPIEKETIELTEEELNKIIEQRVNDALEKTQPETVPELERPSFFKKVANFLFGWMF